MSDRPPQASWYKTAFPPETWPDVFSCITRRDIVSSQLACKKFHGVITTMKELPMRPRTAVSVCGTVEVRAVSGAEEVIVEERARRQRGEDEASTAATISALEAAYRSLDMYFCVVSLFLWLNLTEEFVDALPDAFPRLRDITELKIAYPWWHSPISFEVLRKLRAQLPQLQHFGIENSHGGFDWSIMREEWFLSIPKFSMRFGEVYRPIGFPEEEDRIMQYIFEFSNLPRSASKHVDLSQVCVSDGFLRTLVGRCLETTNKLTVILECSEDTPKPLRFTAPGFEETAVEQRRGTSFRYEHAATGMTMLSEPYKFFVTNVPNELFNREGQVQDVCHLREVYRDAFHRGDPSLLGTAGVWPLPEHSQ
ncbi:hypothetical protein AAVH_09705 [Aphelenchoides avenae]|nr:hypothetical protein AAVH_09705 [Aphelenchus avenae]